MKFTFVSLFPELIKPYFDASILQIAKNNSLFEIDFINPRDFSKDRHQKVDLPKIGGGAGMLMMAEPLDEALKNIAKSSHVVFVSPVGKIFSQNDAKRLAKKSHVSFVCGRYEGIDERIVEKYADEIFSLGDFILTGGELASLCMCDAIARNIPGVLGNTDSLIEESFEDGLLEAPSFTKPNIFDGFCVPLEFLKGNHAKIISLKNKMALCKTKYFRPDLFIKIKKDKK